jgi:hypothetical protein
LTNFFTNRPDIYHADVFASLIKTKHQAVYVTTSNDFIQETANGRRKKILLYDLRPQYIDALRYHLGVFDWSIITSRDYDIQTMYDQFLDVVKAHMHMYIPAKIIRVGKRDPDYVTPYVKALLIKRNRLRKHGKVADADRLAGIINIIISNNMRKRLCRLVSAPIKQVWSALKPDKSERYGTVRTRRLLADADKVNEYYANISTDPDYNEQELAGLRPTLSALRTDFQPLYAYEVEAMLRNVTKTSPGCDCIPHWVFKRCSYELAEVVAHLYNSSLTLGVLPQQWLTAVITPVPKISNPTAISDFRPISVTPILSRVVEKCVVTRWLRPAIPPVLIADQFAFRPTGSTTCALVYMMHHVTRMLEHNAYVRCLLIDFSKAFDRVNHVILVKKLSNLQLPSSILNSLS